MPASSIADVHLPKHTKVAKARVLTDIMYQLGVVYATVTALVDPHGSFPALAQLRKVMRDFSGANDDVGTVAQWISPLKSINYNVDSGARSPTYALSQFPRIDLNAAGEVG
jgi:hypothetical protein